MAKRILFLLTLCAALVIPALAQESQLGAEFRKEGERFTESCGSFTFVSLGSCAQLLFTDHPLHIAVGSIAPQNGFGAGAAFVTHWTPNERWRLSWNADAVGSMNGSWRAGVYMKAVFIPRENIVVTTAAAASNSSSNLTVHEYPVFNVYAQGISLNKLYFFGLGPSSLEADRSVFGMSERIFGANVIWPIFRPLNLSLYGEANGRFVDIRGNHSESSPSIEQLFTNADAPGLASQPGFAQFGEGLRLRPSAFGGYLRFNYSLLFQQYVAAGDSQYSFRRLTVDLSHQIPIYRKTTRTLLPRDINGPDECAEDKSSPKCPAVTRNFEGSFGFRFFLSESFAPSGNAVPFYFQPTLGGSDINGNTALTSFQDYRFRAPNVMLLRESFEHSIWNLPLGVTFIADQGKLSMTRGGFGSSPWLHSYAAGFTLRAGGFPQVFLLFAWGSGEGTHTSATVNTSLLGGSSRPSLF